MRHLPRRRRCRVSSRERIVNSLGKRKLLTGGSSPLEFGAGRGGDRRRVLLAVPGLPSVPDEACSLLGLDCTPDRPGALELSSRGGSGGQQAEASDGCPPVCQLPLEP